MAKPSTLYAPHDHPRGWPRGFGRIATVVGLVLAVGAGDTLWRAAVNPRRGQTDGAEWIWRVAPARAIVPQAFYAVRDFALPEVPAGPVELWVAGDEEYLLWLNGERVGGNHSVSGAGLDAYTVAALLRPGANRLVAQLSSARGQGGFLLLLKDLATERVVLKTDASWAIVPTFHPGLLEAWLPVSPPGAPARPGWVASEVPQVWGSPPTGRWGRPTPPAGGAHRALWRDQLVAPGPWLAQRLQGAAEPSARFDFGREVTGYLNLRFVPDSTPAAPGASGARVALVALAVAAPTRLAAGEPASLLAVLPPGAVVYRDSVPRRFRYVEIYGVPAVDAVSLDPVAALASSPAGPPRLQGLAGIQPPASGAPIEYELRRKLQGLARVPAR